MGMEQNILPFLSEWVYCNVLCRSALVMSSVLTSFIVTAAIIGPLFIAIRVRISSWFLDIFSTGLYPSSSTLISFSGSYRVHNMY